MAKRCSVLLVYKRSFWSATQRRRRPRAVSRANAVAWQHSHAEHLATLQEVIRVLRAMHVTFTLHHRAQLRPIRRVQLVITLGGDGTFLRASHYVQALPVMGVNSDPATSVGFFCCATRQTFQRQFRAWLDHRLPVIPLTRLQARINQRAIPELAVNECLIAHHNPAATSRYIIRAARHEEHHASSGLWVATPAGSTAAVRSAGGYLLPLTSRQYQVVVREPFPRGARSLRLWCQRLSARQRVNVTSLMTDGRVYLDGPHITYPLRWGDRVVFQVAAHPLHAVGIAR